jgi:hypothetical protein
MGGEFGCNFVRAMTIPSLFALPEAEVELLAQAHWKPGSTH